MREEVCKQKQQKSIKTNEKGAKTIDGFHPPHSRVFLDINEGFLPIGFEGSRETIIEREREGYFKL